MRHYLKSTAGVLKKLNHTWLKNSLDLTLLAAHHMNIYDFLKIFAAYVLSHNLNSLWKWESP